MTGTPRSPKSRSNSKSRSTRERSRPRLRSRSPSDSKRHRSSKTYQHHSRHHRDHSPHGHHRRHRSRSRSPSLPFSACCISYPRNFATHDIVFRLWLREHRSVTADALSPSNAEDYFRSFAGRWNERRLSSRWYDPVLNKISPDSHTQQNVTALSQPSHLRPLRPGPTLPSTADLEELRDGHFQHVISTSRASKRAASELHAAHLDELAPRPDPGSKSAQLEKKREKAFSNRQFAAARESGGMAEVSGAVLGLDDGNAELTALKRRQAMRDERSKERRTERDAEVEEKIRKAKTKEDGVMKGLMAMAKERFG